MASKSTLPFAERARLHACPVAKTLLQLAERKKTSLVLSADVTTTEQLLELTDRMSYPGSSIGIALACFIHARTKCLMPCKARAHSNRTWTIYCGLEDPH